MDFVTGVPESNSYNALMEQYLRGYVNYQQNNWSSLLALAEFTHNNAVTERLGVIPFFANDGVHPNFLTNVSPRAKKILLHPEVVAFGMTLAQLYSSLKSGIAYAEATQAEYFNASPVPELRFDVGNQVWLLHKHIHTRWPSSKLHHKKLEKFTILVRIVSHTYPLDLPTSMKVHRVFHVSCLEPVNTKPLLNHLQPPATPVIVDDARN